MQRGLQIKIARQADVYLSPVSPWVLPNAIQARRFLLPSMQGNIPCKVSYESVNMPSLRDDYAETKKQEL